MTTIEKISYGWRTRLGQIIESGQTRSLVLSGNVNDLFYVGPDTQHPHGRYVNLTEHLAHEWGRLVGNILVILKMDGTIQFLSGKREEKGPTDEELVARAWANSRVEARRREIIIERFIRPHATDLPEAGPTFDVLLRSAQGKPAEAMNLLQELCRISRESTAGDPLFGHRLLILVENADVLLPEGQLHQLGAAYQARIIQMREWFADPEFGAGKDVVILVSESKSQINHRLTRLPQMLTCEIVLPNLQERRHFIEWFEKTHVKDDGTLKLWGTKDDLAFLTGALDLHAVRQILLEAAHAKRAVEPKDVVARVQDFIKRMLGAGDEGSDVVKFKRPTHTLDDLVGLTKAERAHLLDLVRRYQSTGKDALSNTIVPGSIGAGKTYRFEALATMLGMAVLELKAIRSKWFGATDIILERLRRVLEALPKVMLFLDEADTQMGGVKADTHETERRLTGTLQSWMSDPAFKGRVIWLMITARPHLLSADIRRKGRGGNLISPVFDPRGDALDEVIEWVLKPSMKKVPGRTTKFFHSVRETVSGWSMGDLSHMRDELIAEANGNKLTDKQALDRIRDELPGDIAEVRRYQELQALLNCTRASLIDPFYLEGNETVTPELRKKWRLEAQTLEAMGIS